MVRSGDEPLHARSPLRLRLGLVVVGLLVAAGFGVRSWVNGFAPGVVGAAVVALGGLLNAGVVARRMRSGAHYQPGPDVPPYRPVADAAPSRGGAEVPENVRQRRYLVLMAVCLTLVSVAWIWVRLVSVPAAVVMSMIAMVIPPIAAVVANAGWSGRNR